MKEFIDKLIGRLMKDERIGRTSFESTVKIINELAEEYKNECCEWKSERDMFIQNPHTGRKFSNEPSMRNVYCNTCGKKIKVAPYTEGE